MERLLRLKRVVEVGSTWLCVTLDSMTTNGQLASDSFDPEALYNNDSVPNFIQKQLDNASFRMLFWVILDLRDRHGQGAKCGYCGFPPASGRWEYRTVRGGRFWDHAATFLDVRKITVPEHHDSKIRGDTVLFTETIMNVSRRSQPRHALFVLWTWMPICWDGSRIVTVPPNGIPSIEVAVEALSWAPHSVKV